MKKKELNNKSKEPKVDVYYPLAKIAEGCFSVNIRSEPTIKSQSVKVLREGELIRIIGVDVNNQYYKVRMESDGRIEGYVPFKYCTKLEDDTGV